ncbi:hypothetical protein ACHAQI_002749 [Fusarium lateritium]
MSAASSTLTGCDQSRKRCLPGAKLSEPRPTKMVCRGVGAGGLVFPGFIEMPEHLRGSAAVQNDYDTYKEFLRVLQELRALRESIQQQIARAVKEALDHDRMVRFCKRFDHAMALPASPLTEDELLARHLDRAITMPSCPDMDLDELEDPAAD